MIVQKIREGSNHGSNQLSLDFAHHSPALERTRVADHIHAITSGNTHFHSKESEIGENDFSIKVSYMGRSYSLKGIYRKEQIRSFHEESFSSTAIRIVRFDSILAFRNGRYISAFLPKKEYEEITGNVQSILSSSYHNTTLH